MGKRHKNPAKVQAKCRTSHHLHWTMPVLCHCLSDIQRLLDGQTAWEKFLSLLPFRPVPKQEKGLTTRAAKLQLAFCCKKKGEDVFKKHQPSFQQTEINNTLCFQWNLSSTIQLFGAEFFMMESNISLEGAIFTACVRSKYNTQIVWTLVSKPRSSLETISCDTIYRVHWYLPRAEGRLIRSGVWMHGI